MQSRLVALLVGIALAGAIGAVDVVTGFEISLGLFYLGPIALVTWYTGTGAGIVLSCVSVVGMFIVDNFVTRHIPFPSSDLIPYWNAAIRLGYFVTFATVLGVLKGAHKRERANARCDFLTGVANSQAFAELYRDELERSRRYEHPISIAFMDCDNFKLVNDRLGHRAGDELLRVVARSMVQNLRRSDSVARLGGDEFGILLPETGPKSARESIEKLRRELLTTMASAQWPVTFSIGVVTFLRPPDSMDEAVGLSDKLMYAVKCSGKNRIRHVIHDRHGALVEEVDTDSGVLTSKRLSSADLTAPRPAAPNPKQTDGLLPSR